MPSRNSPHRPDHRFLSLEAENQRLAHDLEERVKEQRALYDALAAAGARLRAIVESEPVCVKVVSADGILLDMNAAGLRLVGADRPSDVCSRPVLDLIHPADREAFADLHARASAGQSGQLQFRVIGLRGEERWLDTYSTPLREPDGTIRSVLSVTRDVTEQRRTENALRASEARLRNAQRLANLGNWEYEPETEVLHWSDEVYRIFGVSAATFLPTFGNFLRHVHPDDRQRVRRRFEQAWLDVQPFEIEHRIVQPDGTVRHVHQRGTVHRQDGRLVGVGTVQDVTAQREAERDRRESDERFRQLAENIEEVFWLTDIASDSILYISPGFEKIWGRPCDALYADAQLWVNSIHPLDRQRVVDRLADQATGKYREEYRILRPDGSVRWIADRAFPIHDEQGHVYRVAGVAQDITARKEYEVSLRASEERFRLLAKATNDAIWDWDLGSNSLWWNEGFETLFGYRRNEIETTLESWTRRIHPQDRQGVLDSLHASLANGAEGWSAEYRFRRSDGSDAYVLDRGHVIRDASGLAVRMVGGMTDLTPHKRLEERLSEQAALLDAAHDAIYVVDMDDRIVFWSEGAERVYGLSKADVVGRSSAERLRPDPERWAIARDAVLKRREWQGEMPMRAADGRALVMQVSWTLVRDAHGQPKSILAIDTDVTERKALEAQVMRTQRLESIGTLAGGVAHDLNNVLAPILMSIELLREDLKDDAHRALLDTLQASAHRGAELVRQLLSFARGKDGVREPVDLQRVVADIQKIVQDTFPKDIRLSVRHDAGAAVIGDATQLYQVLMNLVVNARDAMPDGGELTIGVREHVIDGVYTGMGDSLRPGSYVAIEVSDTGHGIPPAIQERIFDPFFTTKEMGKGTGLGLSMVATIVKSHGGFVRVRSEVGRGTQFSIYLPAAPSGQRPPVPPTVAQAARGRGELVLVIDDDDGVRGLCKATLERHGYRVLLARDGAEGLSLFAAQPDQIALVITDMVMPVMDGEATVIALRKIRNDVRIVGSTGHASARTSRVWGETVRHVVAKPYTTEALLKTVEAALRDR